jgi:hypothetical protein
LAEVEDLPLGSSKTEGLIDELTKRVTMLSSSSLQTLESLLSSSDFPGPVLQAAIYARRQMAVSEFRHELERDAWKESDWQSFFKREEWIFGHGLLYQFVELVSDEALVGGKDMNNQGGQFTDYAMKTKSSSASFVAFVEIKTPSAKLIGPQYRTHVHGMHENLTSPISQLIGTCDVWNREGSKQEDNVRKSIDGGFYTAHTRGILVVGHMKQLENTHQLRSFEFFRRHLHGIEILTFDEMLYRAERVASSDVR